MKIQHLGIPAIACIAILSALLTPAAARGQNPVQWSGSVKQSVDRAAEQSLPLLIWVKDSHNEIDGNDLEDAQEECFREPKVVHMIQKRFVALRVSRNSRVIEEAGKLGLPTGFGNYCAVITFDGRLMEQMGPGEVAMPQAFLQKLNSGYSKFCDDLYEKEVRPLLENPSTSKSKQRLAAQTVYRLGIRQADTGIIGLLSRPDLLPHETSRLYDLLASLGTKASIDALLERASEAPAATALGKAHPGALEWVLPELPAAEGEVTEKQFAAYAAAAKICHTAAKASQWWEKSTAKLRQEELDRIHAKATVVMEYWREHEGVAE
jgi:hypothetical protein